MHPNLHSDAPLCTYPRTPAFETDHLSRALVQRCSVCSGVACRCLKWLSRRARCPKLHGCAQISARVTIRIRTCTKLHAVRRS